MDSPSINETKATGVALQKYKDILKSNGITKPVSEIVLNIPEKLKGAGTTSQIIFVTVKFEDSSEPLQLCTKAPAPNVLEEVVGGLYEKEMQFLNEYVPAAEKFCMLKGKPRFLNFYPACYYAGKDMIVYENLLNEGSGFIMIDKFERQDFEPAVIALQTLAKHHAVSYAFIQSVLGGSEEFIEMFPALIYETYSHEILKKMLDAWVNHGIMSSIKLLKKTDIEGKEEAISLLKSNYGKATAAIWDLLNYRPEEEPLLVLNHGDYWNNNMLFQIDEETKSFTGAHKVFDFQVLRYNSPAVDVASFLYTSVKAEVRQNRLKELLEVYLQTLTETSRDLGVPTKMGYEEFFQLYRKKALYGFWFSLFWLAVDRGFAGFNISESTDQAKADEEVDKFVQNHINATPEKSCTNAKDLVKLMQEYTNLGLDKLK